MKLFADPSANIAELADVTAGACSTVRVNDWLASGFTPLLAPMVTGNEPPVPAPGVPDNVAVPLPLSTKLMPAGNVPVSEIAGVGLPVVVTSNVPADPAVKVVELADVMAGNASTIRVKDCVASLPTPLLALTVTG